jgi:multidrug efflux pump subunit AcrB
VQQQNAMTAAGTLNTDTTNVNIRVEGLFQTTRAIEDTTVMADGRLFRVSDLAKVHSGASDPPDPLFYYSEPGFDSSKPAVGLMISMVPGGNILELGERLSKTIEELRFTLPVGMEISQVCNQPQTVEESIDVFVETLILAVIIVLGVSFCSLGVRAGFVVAASIPLVLCSVFVAMRVLGIDLHKISLGALIIALGLLVDDAIIAIEMMEVKLEEKWRMYDAATFAYRATAFPMLTGTLITSAAFLPVGIAKGSAAEYAGTLCSVVGLSLVISWFVSVTVIPLLGSFILKERKTALPKESEAESEDKGHQEKDSIFTRVFRAFLVFALRHRWLVIAATVACFVATLAAYGQVQRQFFPPTTRPELIVDMTLPAGSSLKATDAEVQRFLSLLAADEECRKEIVNVSSYVGNGAPRFVLTLSVQNKLDHFSESIILCKDRDARDRLSARIQSELTPQFPNVLFQVKILTNGPPSDAPVMFRVLGDGRDHVVKTAERVRDLMYADSRVDYVRLRWYEQTPTMRMQIDQDKARAIGASSAALKQSLQQMISGTKITEFYDDNLTIDVKFRTSPQGRQDLSRVRDLDVHVGNGVYVPVDQVANIVPGSENSILWRRDRQYCITLYGYTAAEVQGNDVAAAIWKSMEDLRKELPANYSVQMDGDLESSERAAVYLSATYPVMIGAILFLLMFQLQHIGKMCMVLATAPLGLIGVIWSLIIFGKPMGFVAQLGVLALSGMIMRNSVILIDQIMKREREGESAYQAIIDSTLMRFRPIILTAAAAILGMAPLFRDIFWGPMAASVAGGLFIATILTLVFLPAFYAACFRVKGPAVRKSHKSMVKI